MNPLNTLFDPNFTPKIKSIIAGYTGNLNLTPLVSKTKLELYRNLALCILQQWDRISRLLPDGVLRSLRDRLLINHPKEFVLQAADAIAKRALKLGMPKENIQFRDSEKMFEDTEAAIRDRDLCVMYSDIVHNQFFTKSIQLDPTIESLPLGSRKAKRIDEWLKSHVDELKEIWTLTLNFLDLSTLPVQIKYFTDLKDLDASENRIENLAEAVFPDSVRHLDLSDNRIKSLAHVHWPPNLVELHLSDNKVDSLGESNLPGTVDFLHLESNNLVVVDGSELPVSLKKLHLDENPIRRVVNLKHLTQLCKLRLGDFKPDPKDLPIGVSNEPS